MPLKRKINSINAVRCKRYRKNKANKTDCKDNGKTFTASSNINLQGENDLNKEKAIFDCMKYLNRTHNGHNSHCACVCVVCDSFIVDTGSCLKKFCRIKRVIFLLDILNLLYKKDSFRTLQSIQNRK